jgi:hypothetical protein
MNIPAMVATLAMIAAGRAHSTPKKDMPRLREPRLFDACGAVERFKAGISGSLLCAVALD